MNDWHDAERRVERAQELFDQRKWQEALEELRQAVRINPFNGAWFFNIGLILDELTRYEEALDAYREAVKIEPNNLQSLNNLGVDLHRTGRFKQALRTFERIAAVDATFEPCYCQRIVTYSELGDHEKAEEMFYTARLYKEECPNCYYNIGCSLAARGVYDKAIYCFQKCVDMDGAHPQTHCRLAECLWKKGELEQARRHYLSDLRQSPGRTETLLDLGELLLDMGRVEEAGEKFRRAIELAPNHPGGYFRHGRWLLRFEKFGAAQGQFLRVLQLDPTFVGAHLELARLAHRRGDGEETRAHLRSELLLRPQESRVLLGLANLWMDIDESRTAIACLKRLIGQEQGNADAWLNLAVAQFTRREYEEGIGSCQRVLALEPRNTLAMYNLALAFERMGRFQMALDWTRRAMQLEPKDVSLQRLEIRLRILKFKARVVSAVRRMLRV